MSTGLAVENLRQRLLRTKKTGVMDLAKRLNVKGRSNKSKPQLIEMILAKLKILREERRATG